MIDRLRVRRILAGDPVATDRWILEAYPQILRFLRHLTGSATEAEDLAQITFVKAKAGMASFRHDASLTTWMHRIAYREFARWLRERREYPEPLPDHASCNAGRSDDAVVLATAIADLPQDLRDAFVLREIQCLSVRESASILRVPEGTIKSRNHLARERLRTSLAGTWEVANGKKLDGGRHEPV